MPPQQTHSVCIAGRCAHVGAHLLNNLCALRSFAAAWRASDHDLGRRALHSLHPYPCHFRTLARVKLLNVWQLHTDLSRPHAAALSFVAEHCWAAHEGLQQVERPSAAHVALDCDGSSIAKLRHMCLFGAHIAPEVVHVVGALVWHSVLSLVHLQQLHALSTLPERPIRARSDAKRGGGGGGGRS